MIPPRLRAPLAASGAALLLLLGFPDSLGLWPLRLVADWPDEIGRAVGSLLFAGRLGPLALSQATDFQIRGATLSQQALANALGLVAQLAAGLALFWQAEREGRARLLLLILAGCTGLAAILPPLSHGAYELGAALSMALAGSWPAGWKSAQERMPELFPSPDVVPRTGLQFLAGAMVTTPLADLRPSLLSIGRASGPVAILEAQSGIPAWVWALLIAALVVTGLVILLRDKPGKVRPA